MPLLLLLPTLLLLLLLLLKPLLLLTSQMATLGLPDQKCPPGGALGPHRAQNAPHNMGPWGLIGPMGP